MAKYTPKRQDSAAPKRRRRKWLAPTAWCVVAVAMILSAGLTWDSAAKYFQNFQRETAVKAKEFYFTSDYLTPTGETYHIRPGITEIAFELRNEEGLNVSEMDIDYEVTVSPAATVDKATGCIEVAKGKETITLSDLQAGETYEVTVTGSKGYQQTLRATFIVDAADTGIFKNTKNYGDYVILTIWTADAGAEVTFKVPDGLIPDATDAALRNITEDREITVTLGAHESRTLRFFTTGAYTGGEIDVTGATETTLN